MEHYIVSEQRKFETPGPVPFPEDRVINEIMYNGVFFSNHERTDGPALILTNGLEAYGQSSDPKYKPNSGTERQNRLYVISGNGKIEVLDRGGSKLRVL